MTPLQTYLTELQSIRSTGAAVPETSYYGALANLFNAVGKSLKPKVSCVINLANRGAGIPDGGLFTADQLQKGGGKPVAGAVPSRGVIEVKGSDDDSFVTAQGQQVTKYWKHYGLVLVTNYRDFVLVGKDDNGNPLQLETFRLAADEAAFWRIASHPAGDAVTGQESRFTDFLQRVMLHNAALERPQDLAWFLASYARDALGRIEGRKLPALDALRVALEESLGLKFEGRNPQEAQKWEHFFRSTLVQTLFYGVFSAWVLWHTEKPGRKDRFEWKQAAYQLQVPIIRTLFYQLADPAKLASTGLVEPLEWAAAALNRVHRGVFFSSFDRGLAVQYFYEPFLEHFDPELRKELGVWYTPPEIVKYMVNRVDTVLREELDRPDGLADKDVVILDPCCGTGAYLVEVIEKIAETMKAKGNWDAGSADELKKAVTQRVFGFEILPAPFVVAHLQLGLLLQNLGVPLSHETSERAGVYLTNSLTGWEPPKGPKQHLIYPEMEQERDAADVVKQKQPILVIIGNPPYNAFAGISPEEEAGLVEPYKDKLNLPVAKGGWGIKKFNLDDLYVRFFRIAEKRIAHQSGQGVVCFISNASYLSDPSFVVMREKYCREFDAMWFDSMNGDSRETGKLTPDGKPDPSVFSTEYNTAGIRVGTSIGLMVRRGTRAKQPTVMFREFWGSAKRDELLKSLRRKSFDRQYLKAKPAAQNRYTFRPSKVNKVYSAWPKLTDLCALPPFNGLMEKRGGALIDSDPEQLAKRMQIYLDPKLDWDEYRLMQRDLTRKQAGFAPKAARAKILAAESFAGSNVVRFTVRPFDLRWCYYTQVNPIWNRARPSYYAQCWKGNRFLLCRPAAVASPEGGPLYFTGMLGDNDLLRGHAYYFPLQLMNGQRLEKQAEESLFSLIGGKPQAEQPFANLSEPARRYLATLKLPNPDQNADTARAIWYHALAVGYSPAYLDENAEGIRGDWPRIPLPATAKQLRTSAELGQQVAALLDSESPVKGVTVSPMRDELRLIGSLRKNAAPAGATGGAINPAKSDLDITAGWGHAGKGGVTMPGGGRVIRRDYEAEEKKVIRNGAAKLGLTLEQAINLLGHQTCDVYLNGSVYWCNIPENVYGFVIGGYQVIKKWLSYREKALLGRAITMEEARHVQATARRLSALLLLHPGLDANYARVNEGIYEWVPGT